MERPIEPQRRNPLILNLVQKILLISPPRLRALVSRTMLKVDDLYEALRRRTNRSESWEWLRPYLIGISPFRTLVIGGKEFPYVYKNNVDKASLKALNLQYKRFHAYKPWHTPEGQFDLLRRLYNIDNNAVSRPIALVVGDSKKIDGYIMSQVKGTDLDTLLRRKRINPIDTLEVERQINEIIERLHSNGIGHGYLNKGNIIVNDRLEIKLIDPLDGRSDARNIKDDTSWLLYLGKELERYREKCVKNERER